jgi:glucose 1-dehydrogenase
MPLENRVAIVTGAARGIGQAIAARFVEEGARVVIADIDAQAGEDAAEVLRARGADAIAVGCNVGERLDIHNLLAATLDAYGAVDILVNNAGIVAKANFLDLDEETFDRVMRVNLKGTFLAAQAAARQMVLQVEEGRAPGSIINMSSINAVLAIPDQIPYVVSKGGISQLTKALALALAPHGIRVNAIGPGSIMTQMLESVAQDASARRMVLSRTPLRRIGEPREIAGIAAFLASEDSSYVTGQTIYADGGRLGLNYVVSTDEDG